MGNIHFTENGAMFLQCFADDPDADSGQIIDPVDPGDSWDTLAAKVREHQAEHGCAPAGPQPATPIEVVPKRYALVEQMGYRHDIAAVREVTFAGKQMIELTRLDDPAAVRLISPDSLYGITWLTEEEARSRAKPWTAAALPAGGGDPDDADPWQGDNDDAGVEP
jgi:hypothetical protein